MLKKLDYVKNSIREIENVFICPVCKNDMYLFENSLKCHDNHCFDISKKGCLTLMKNTRKINEKIYDNMLFQNRTEFINYGFYEKMHKKIAEIISDSYSEIIVDMGCGDGTHDKKICDLVDNKKINLIGIDLSKVGVEYFSNYVSDNFIPVVSDLNNMPINDSSVDLILNILSPSNENEMKRILKKDGLIIKVTPKRDYLKELRDAFSIKEYENEEIIESNIRKNYVVVDKFEINDNYNMNSVQSSSLVMMTPLTRTMDKNVNIDNITISLNIYVLKIKEN